MSARSYDQALQDFHRARQEAALRQLLARFSGQSERLLAYREVSEKIKITDTIERGLQEIPLSAIVGSVGRADDFTRDFLPKRDSDAQRWANVKAAVIDMKGWSPIEVYKIGDAYFVKDGNHRVSVARQLGNDTISAYVTEVETRLPLDVGEDPTAIICRANYIDFLEKTRLDESHPEANLDLTFCNQYSTLLRQIEEHQERLNSTGHTLSLPEAAADWYENVYLPLIRLIRNQGVLRDFRDRTETDMFVLLSERREELEEALGWELKQESTVSEIVSSLVNSRSPLLSRVGFRLRDAFAPELADGPPPGQWRRQRKDMLREGSLFNDILVSLQGTDADWRLLDSTLQVAQREQARMMALHAVSREADLESGETVGIRNEFYRRCAEAGIEGQFAAEVGNEGKLMIKRAPWTDLVATNLTFATDFKPQIPLSPSVRMLIQRCPRPILVMAGESGSPMDRALLAYDGSPKSNEALFVGTYFALRWQIDLTVLTVTTNKTKPEDLDRARRYLIGNHLVNVNYILGQEPITDSIMEAVVSQKRNFLIVGGFGYRPWQHIVLGSTVDELLIRCQLPILICR